MTVGAHRPKRILPWLVTAILILTGTMASSQTLSVQPLNLVGTVSAADWEAYRSRFVEDSGRVVDTANGNISHSEGQGYGLLLRARGWGPRYLRADLELHLHRISHPRRRPRSLEMGPSSKPRITDRNNATDGDILIAYALARAGAAWQEDPLHQRGAEARQGHRQEHLEPRPEAPSSCFPASKGFGAAIDRTGRSSISPIGFSRHFRSLAALAPEYEWSRVWRDGVCAAAAGDLRPRCGFRPTGFPCRAACNLSLPTAFRRNSVTTR